MSISPTILTAIGRTKLASATPEQQLKVSHFAIGDGLGSYTPVYDTMPSLVNEVWRGPASAPMRDPGNASVMIWEGVVPANVGGFFVREAAIFDVDGDMIAVGHVSLIEKVATGTTPITLTVRLRVMLSNTADVTLFYSDMAMTAHGGLSGRSDPQAHPASAISYDPGTGEPLSDVQAALRSLGKRVAPLSLDGPVMVYPGSSNTYRITDFDAFSLYEANSSLGTASLEHETLTLQVPAEAVNTQIDLILTRDGVAVPYVIAVGAAIIKRPAIVSPIEGDTGVPLVPTLHSSAFAAAPSGADVHYSSHWRIWADAGKVTQVWDSGITSANLTTVAVPSGVLASNTAYFIEVRHSGETLGDSAWSELRGITTANRYVQPPALSVTGTPANTPEQPVLTTSAFTVYNGSDDHHSTDWRIKRVSDSVVVWSSLGDIVNKTSITLPAGVLQVSTDYVLEARHNGAVLGASVWGGQSFRTRDEFFTFGPASYGKPYGGGYYAGNIYQEDGLYALIVAEKAAETSLMFAPVAHNMYGQPSDRDGHFNTWSLLNKSTPDGSTPGNWYAASYCRNYRGGGHADWFLPAQHQLEIAYRNLKPTATANHWSQSGVNPYADPATDKYTAANPAQTTATAFRTGGTQAWVADYYTTSTALGANSGYAIYQNFSDGFQTSMMFTIMAQRIRPMRQIKIN